MPELPEVEVVVRQLLQNCCVLNRQIVNVTYTRPNRWPGTTPADVIPKLIGRMFRHITRRGKFIIFHLDDSAQLIIHLRMTGKLLWQPAGPNENKFTRETFYFQDGSSLQFNDARTLGRLYYVAPHQVFEPLVKLGPEPFDPEFTPEKLSTLLQHSNLEIKDFLLNQSKIAGLGNIYAAEVLFRCRLHPQQRARHLKAREINDLHDNIRQILQTAIEMKGTTISDYRNAENHTGEFQRELKVYGRVGEACVECGTPIERMMQKQRSTYFCPRCQKRKRSRQ
ncbi:DNA-formamidopyrimidine glycosylase [candidate division KSB1 bacterium]|nr:DNA-formamidopyrimidine glycosylase [candidate division KSB1 bacterium]